ncbi:uncharacterized protein LOC128198937 [Bicyclus anynana]|uniref:Uncharacterized protein LOC112048624 n=1 Tax=Bicyclus anynana TaxID=110368 RepID=A0A6J1NAH2_BICAN|nr:uncharacterized protein LOC112048624 [Bicyclus anynana]XP_052742711.1 uncharacterized protein LOC128198937 [Bicyclus anynana]
MENQFQILFEKMKNEMRNQTDELKESILEKLDEKLQPIIAENKNLKTKLDNLEKEIESLKRGKKQNNLIIYGVKEDEKSTPEIIQKVKEIFKADLDLHFEDYEVNKIYRIGNKQSSCKKPRPILFSFVNEWKKSEVMKRKKSFKDVYVSEDYSKEVLEKRKMLQSQLKEERNKGNIAYLKFDKLIIREKVDNTKNEKRKREMSTSPQQNTQPRKQQYMKPSNKLNAYDLMKIRSNSLPSNTSRNTTTNKQ